MTRRLLSTTSRSFARLALGAYDAVAVLTCAALASFALIQPAYAYVDPSVMTYTIQALAGVAVALSAVAGVAFRRSRRAIMRALNIDENANKEQDFSFKRITPDEANLGKSAEAFESRGAHAARAGALKSGRRSGKSAAEAPVKLPRRIVLSLLVSVFLSITLLVMAPFETLAGSISSLVFGLNDIWQPILVEAAAVAFALTVVLSLLRGRAFNLALMLIFSFALCCYVQAMFLNTGMPATDGRTPEWFTFKTMAVVSAAVWIAIMVVPFEFSKWKRKAVQTVVGAVAACLVVVQGVAVGSILADMQERHHSEDEDAAPASQYIMTKKDLYTVSPTSNVIFFVLDTYDTTDMIKVLQKGTDFEQELTGFTWFRDSVGAMSPTRYGVPYLLTGEYPEADEPWEEYVAQRYLRSTYLSDIYDAGYSIGLYSDTLGDYIMSDDDRRNLIYDKTTNIVAPPKGQAPEVDVNSTLWMMLRVAAYRDLLWLAKPFSYFTTDELNRAMVGSDSQESADSENNRDDLLDPYVMDDAAWYENLREQGLTFEEHDDKGAFRFIHLIGTHQPYEINEYGERDLSSTEDQQALGSLRMVTYYLNQMKELGVYDDATIIITADHGIWWESEPGPLPWVASPLMLVKPSGAENRYLQVSDAEVVPLDALATVVDAVGADADKYGPTIFEQDEYLRDRRYILTHTWSNVDLDIVEYQIQGDVLNEYSWSRSGVSWDPSNTPR